MIKNIFLPERIGNHFLLSPNFLGLEISKTALFGTKVHISGSKGVVKEFYHESILIKTDTEYEDSLVEALQKLMSKADLSSHLKLSLPNHITIFKELTFPFLEEEKIRQTLPYELEPQIPFSIKDIVYDFITVAQNQEKKESTILVAIVQKKDLEYYLSLLEKVNIDVASVTVDLFAIYGLFLQNPAYQDKKEAMALIDIGFQYSTISYINNKELLAIRTVNIGLNQLLKNIAQKTKSSPSAILEQFIRLGIKEDDKELAQAVEEEFSTLFRQIQFTFDAFATQISPFHAITQLVLITRSTKIKRLDELLEENLKIPTEFFNTTSLLKIDNLDTKAITKIPLSNIISLGAAYPFSPTSNFNFLSSYETKKDKQLLQYQLIVTIVMFVLFFSSLITYGYIQRRTLRQKINRAKQSTLKILYEELDIESRNIFNAVEEAENKVNEAESIWEGFSGQRSPFLKYLQELCVKIDHVGIGLDLKKLSMNKKNITINGQVRNYSALKTFEEELNESKLFKLASVPQEPKFDIKLIIKNEGEAE